MLKRDPGYWDAKDYHFDQVIYHPIPNSAVRLANLQAGSLDIVEYIDPADIATVQHDPKLRLAMWDGLGYTGINFNIGNGPAQDWVGGKSALVRQAFELSIDPDGADQVVYAGLFTPTAQANPPSSPMYVPAIQPPARDVARAKALLQQAGVTLPVQLTLMTTNNPDTQQAGEVIQAMAQEAGFDVKLKVLEFASSLQSAYDGAFPGLHDRLVRTLGTPTAIPGSFCTPAARSISGIIPARRWTACWMRPASSPTLPSGATSTDRCGSRNAATCRWSTYGPRGTSWA